MYSDLKGKTGIITGSSSGIGAAIAKRFVKEGINVVVNYYDDEKSAVRIVRDIKQEGGKAIALHGDVKKEKDMHQLLENTINQFGDMDIWVNNAGIQRSVPSHEMSLTEWQNVIDTNLTGVFIGAREALNHFLKKKKRGNIINISSVHEVIPWKTYAHYAASKGGVKMLTQTLVLEYAGKGIRINSIAPGGIQTDISKNDGSENNRENINNGEIPMGYIGNPEEIANVAAWLASSESSYITGATIIADGGMTLYP